MADQKISQLSDGGASQAADEYVIARSGANYRIDGASVAAAATSVGTLTSLTVSGATSLQSQTTMSRQAGAAVNLLFGLRSGVADIATDTAGTIRFLNAAQSSVNMSIADAGDVVIRNNLTVDTNTLYVDAANNRVGVGTASPGATFHVNAPSGSNTNIALSENDSIKWYIGNVTGSSTFRFYDNTAGAERLRIDASGNLGLGVTPSAWETASSKALQFTGGSIWSFSTSQLNLLQNAFYNTAGNLTYINNAAASAYRQISGVHSWYTAGAGTGTISFTQAMTLDASGNLGIGTSSPTISAAATGIDLYDATDVQFRLHTGVSGTGLSDGFVLSMASDNTVYLYGYENAPMIFATNNNERARITSAGTLNVGTNPDSGAVGTYLAGYNGFAAQISNNLFYNFSGTNATGTRTFYVEGDGDVYNTNGTYGTISDIKHKQDVIDAPSQWDDLKAIRFRKFRMKSDVKANPDAPYLLGVVAQELEQTSPGLIEQHPDFEEQEVTDDDGNVTTERVQVGTTKTVKSSILLMKAAVALQEAMARIETLEAHSAALEARLEALEA